MHSNNSPCFSGVPSFFRACCVVASQGGEVGFDHPGRELMRHVRRLVPHELEDTEWSEVCDQLDTAITEGDRRLVLEWFVTAFPCCMALVPKRRRETFLNGVFDMAAPVRQRDKRDR